MPPRCISLRIAEHSRDLVHPVLTEEHLQRKWAALTKYQSQLEVARPYFRYEFIESMARVRGLQVKSDFAEAYEAIRVRL